jgi:hypothetical protein
LLRIQAVHVENLINPLVQGDELRWVRQEFHLTGRVLTPFGFEARGTYTKWRKVVVSLWNLPETAEALWQDNSFPAQTSCSTFHMGPIVSKSTLEIGARSLICLLPSADERCDKCSRYRHRDLHDARMTAWGVSWIGIRATGCGCGRGRWPGPEMRRWMRQCGSR